MLLRICLLNKRAWENYIWKTELLLFPWCRAKSACRYTGQNAPSCGLRWEAMAGGGLGLLKSQSPGLSDSGFNVYLYTAGFLLLGWFWERSSGGMFNLEIFFPLLASRFSLPTGQTDQEPACPEQELLMDTSTSWGKGSGRATEVLGHRRLWWDGRKRRPCERVGHLLSGLVTLLSDLTKHRAACKAEGEAGSKWKGESGM